MAQRPSNRRSGAIAMEIPFGAGAQRSGLVAAPALAQQKRAYSTPLRGAGRDLTARLAGPGAGFDNAELGERAALPVDWADRRGRLSVARAWRQSLLGKWPIVPRGVRRQGARAIRVVGEAVDRSSCRGLGAGLCRTASAARGEVTTATGCRDKDRPRARRPAASPPNRAWQRAPDRECSHGLKSPGPVLRAVRPSAR